LRLADEKLARRMESRVRHGLHVRFADMFHDHRDAVFPHKDLLVVGCRDELLVVVDEEEAVDGTQVLIVNLRDFVALDVPLNDFLVVLCHEELVLFGFVRVYLDAEG